MQACPHFSIQKKNARPHKSSNVWKCNAVWKQTSLSDKIRFLSVSMSSGEEEKRRKIRKKNARGLDTRKSILSVYNISGATARMPSSCVLLLLAKCTSVFAVVFFSFSHHIFHWHCAPAVQFLVAASDFALLNCTAVPTARPFDPKLFFAPRICTLSLRLIAYFREKEKTKKQNVGWTKHTIDMIINWNPSEVHLPKGRIAVWSILSRRARCSS